MTIDDDEIYRLMEEIWTSMLSLELERPRHKSSNHSDRGTLTGCVHISGAWEGAAVLSCATELAHRITKIMFGMPEVSEGEVCDAIGELTNITAGQIQSLLPRPSELSLPSVVEGRDYRVNIPKCSLLSEISLECQGQPITIKVVQSSI
ncbi:MAG TPA: chemotaxis protein CheX [Candidatus Binataceae bacterium]|nr:chemotaxis protein CheX [Candidatus Binataceae bacterium]